MAVVGRPQGDRYRPFICAQSGRPSDHPHFFAVLRIYAFCFGDMHREQVSSSYSLTPTLGQVPRDPPVWPKRASENGGRALTTVAPFALPKTMALSIRLLYGIRQGCIAPFVF